MQEVKQFEVANSSGDILVINYVGDDKSGELELIPKSGQWRSKSELSELKFEVKGKDGVEMALDGTGREQLFQEMVQWYKDIGGGSDRAAKIDGFLKVLQGGGLKRLELKKDEKEFTVDLIDVDWWLEEQRQNPKMLYEHFGDTNHLKDLYDRMLRQGMGLLSGRFGEVDFVEGQEGNSTQKWTRSEFEQWLDLVQDQFASAHFMDTDVEELFKWRSENVVISDKRNVHVHYRTTMPSNTEKSRLEAIFVLPYQVNDEFVENEEAFDLIWQDVDKIRMCLINLSLDVAQQRFIEALRGKKEYLTKDDLSVIADVKLGLATKWGREGRGDRVERARRERLEDLRKGNPIRFLNNDAEYPGVESIVQNAVLKFTEDLGVVEILDRIEKEQQERTTSSSLSTGSKEDVGQKGLLGKIMGGFRKVRHRGSNLDGSQLGSSPRTDGGGLGSERAKGKFWDGFTVKGIRRAKRQQQTGTAVSDGLNVTPANMLKRRR